LLGLERYRDASRVLLSLNTVEYKQKARHVLQWVLENEKGNYDFLALHSMIIDDKGPMQLPCVSFLSPKVMIKDTNVSNRGKGVFAMAELQEGELVIASKPELVIFNSDLTGLRIDWAPGWDEDGLDCTADTLLMQRLAGRVLANDEQRKRLLSLSRGMHEVRTAHDEAALLQLLQVVKTNRFTASEPWEDKSTGTGIWITPSRLNHACNASCSWCTIGDMLFVRCQRRVAAGEELTISYCNPTDGVQERLDSLFSRHGFVCKCELCTVEKNCARGPEDYNRRLALAKTLSSRAKPDFQMLLKLHTSAFEYLSSAEYCSLRHTQTEHAMAACAACYKLQHLSEAKQWLQRARQAFVLQWGSDLGVFKLFAQKRGLADAGLF